MKWTQESLSIEAQKYATRSSFRAHNNAAYKAARRRGILTAICAHMTRIHHTPYTKNEIKKIALRFSCRSHFKRAMNGAYKAACQHGILDDVCAHMLRDARVACVPHNKKWTLATLCVEAANYKSRCEFENKNGGAYNAALRLGIMDDVCQHMTPWATSSTHELELFLAIKRKYPKVIKLRDRKVSIPGKPYIHGFDLDAYIPALKKGIEFDGTYFHSVRGLRRSRTDWPYFDLLSYRQIKDAYFSTKGIKVMHIDEKVWLMDKAKCMRRVFSFLEN